MAIEKWEDDHSMILWEINRQCDSLLDMIGLIIDDGDMSIFADAITKWSIKETSIQNLEKLIAWMKGESSDDITTLSVDWSMVLYEYKKQYSAANSY